jgi:hypothetical protein
VNHPSGTFYIAPASDHRDEFAAGYDANVFATREQAESEIPHLIAAIGGEWTAEVRS